MGRPAAEAADDDEPLPAGYGVRPAAERPVRERREPADGERRGRRRRRRGGEGRSSESSATSSAKSAERGGSRDSDDKAGRRGRRRRRRGEGESGGSAEFSRGRRRDFATVSGGRDEDDEGLEFLGLEEEARETVRRETGPEDDDVLVESGLGSVLDVPSWVEAIGIVIAGNLDARSRSPRGDDSRRGGR